MKHGLIALTLLITILGLEVYKQPAHTLQTNQQPAVTQAHIAEVKSVEAVEKAQDWVYPDKIIIKKISLNTQVVPVGQTETGNMDIPVYIAGWYKYGVKPGQTGNSVIDGHYDQEDGTPGIFHRIPELMIGDEITIADKDGNTAVFEIYKMEQYPAVTFPLQQVFGKTTEKNLNLITCAGEFDHSKGEYKDRLVVYSRLKTA